MNISKWSGAVRGLALIAATACALPSALASDRMDGIFSKVSPSLRDRMFWNLQVVSTKIKTDSDEPKDARPGGVISIADMVDMTNALRAELSTLDPDSDRYKIIQAKFASSAYDYSRSGFNGISILETALVTDYGFTGRTGSGTEEDPYVPGNAFLGTPKGIKAKAEDPSKTIALSIGYFLDDEHRWAVEALVLGAPLKATVKGDGTNDQGTANQIAGKDIINTKLLPPLVKLGYYFGGREARLRPYVGVGAMYAVFFDTKTTATLDSYLGGRTTVNIKNAFGIGPFLGLESRVGESDWKVGLSVGRIKLTADATLVTRGTTYLTASPVLGDYKANTVSAIRQGAPLFASFANSAGQATGVVPFPNGDFTAELLKDVAEFKQRERGGDGSLGTFVRTQRSELSNTIFMLNVGKSF